MISEIYKLHEIPYVKDVDFIIRTPLVAFGVIVKMSNFMCTSALFSHARSHILGVCDYLDK